MPPLPKNPPPLWRLRRSLAGGSIRRLSAPQFLADPLRTSLPPSLCHPARLNASGAAQCRFTSSAVAARDRSSRKTLVYLLAVAGAMVGASYAAVPLYRRFCQATGYGGTVQRREVYKHSNDSLPLRPLVMDVAWLVTRNGSLQSVEEKIARHARDGTRTSRELVVQFNADVADGMPWKFIPTQREIRVKPGESALAFYTAENCSSSPITGVSTYNVTPMKFLDDLSSWLYEPHIVAEISEHTSCLKVNK
ncbi:Cytochrome c oxidase assembly protein COX11, mitochondrial [Apostasia shenzhenica]|uniref:Cytochrome c oxidase assembly protein COX11, mitochondrial n=1 Tax=Apostasia shenzhenica TaxID=1088818 RepID=A0A2I0BCZ9_9ASPA|nr:Cytochrome c oxidase assembly protein COX11, mitochondrial [Apostasia shenzhenica]